MGLLKSGAVTLANLALHPRLFTDFTRWSRKLDYTPFSRIQYSLLSANLAMRPASDYGYDAIKKEALIIAIIFDVDYYLDQVVGKQAGYEEIMESIFDKGKYKELVEELVEGFTPEEATQVKEEIRKLTSYAALLDQTQVTTMEEYLDIGAVTIAMPCLAMIAEFSLNEKADPKFIKLSSDITRIVNDRASAEKDAGEGTKNIYNLFGSKDVDQLLKKLIVELNAYNPQNRVERFMLNLTRLGIKLYAKGDFEL